MKSRQLSILICLPLIFINLYAVLNNITWLSHLGEILIFIPLLLGFSKKLDFTSLNLSAFLGLSILSIIMSFFEDKGFFYLVSVFLRLVSYFFLMREALKYTKRQTGNKLMLIFFFLLIGVNAYFVFRHVQELEIYMTGIVELGFYSGYYLDLLVLSIVALIYYLNSYSRKSVFFIILVMGLVISDILRDMSYFYFPDISVLIMKNFLSMIAIIMVFRFFSTEERKLRLINLV